MKYKIYFTLAIILINAIFFILGLFDIFDFWPLYQIPLFQMGWLLGLADAIGLPVNGRSNEFAAMPNAFGLTLVVIGTLITIMIYWYLAKFLFKRKKA